MLKLLIGLCAQLLSDRIQNLPMLAIEIVSDTWSQYSAA